MKFPWLLRFDPQPGLPRTDASVNFKDSIPPRLPANTHMFNVMALDKPGTPGMSDPDSDWHKIGEIWNTSEFTQSLWGDERLFF